MIIWSIIIYLLIGMGLLIYMVKTDKYGGLILHFWWLIVLFYPFLIIKSMFSKN